MENSIPVSLTYFSKFMTKFNHITQKHLKYEDLRCIEDNEIGRRYVTPSGEKYPSITTVLALLSKDAIQEWKERVGEEEAERVSRFASKRGTKVHEMAEDYLNNVPYKEIMKGLMPLYKFNFDTLKPLLNRINNIYYQEAALYSDTFKIAGRVDCIAEFDGVLSVIDFKTSAKPKEKGWIESYFIQTSFYAAAFYELTGIPIKQIVIMITTDVGQCQVFKENPFKFLKKLKEIRQEYSRQKLFGHIK